MSPYPFRDLPTWAMVLSIGAHLAVGLFLGLFHFRTLRWNASQLATEGLTAGSLALMAGRFVLLAGVLTLASLEGAVPLLVTASGILVGRWAVMRRVRMAAP